MSLPAATMQCYHRCEVQVAPMRMGNGTHG
jgi:hypothetical protein